MRIVNQKHYLFLGGILEINTTIEDLKDVGVVVPMKSTFNSLICPKQKTDEYWEMTVDSLNLIQVVTPIATAVSDVVLFLSKLAHPLITGKQLFIWKVLFLHLYQQRSLKAVFFQLLRPAAHLHFSPLEGYQVSSPTS